MAVVCHISSLVTKTLPLQCVWIHSLCGNPASKRPVAITYTIVERFILEELREICWGVAGCGEGVTVRQIRRTSIRRTSFCGFSVVHMRTWKEVARHDTGGSYKPQKLRDNGRLSQLGNGNVRANTWWILATEKMWDVTAMKGKVRTLTCHEGTVGNTGSSTLSLTSASDEVGG